ncbi:hypothetical protein [Brevundimonas phoenicis]|jgi:hypothetical protein|uniref:hypothetical protein n=1 Tax=unclassified Brevundimonas TaxID=2622653 RepID=UPI0039A1F978
MINQNMRGYECFWGSAAELAGLMRDIRNLFSNSPKIFVVSDGNCDVDRASGPVQSPTTYTAFIGHGVLILTDIIRLESQA